MEGYLVRNHAPFWYTDGSGGKYAEDERLIRAGWGAVAVTPKVRLSHSVRRCGELCMDRSQVNCKARIVRRFGPSFSCWSVPG